MTAPEDKMREVVDACADCDVCRHLMDADCLFFPELFRLFDKESAIGKAISPQELRHLADQCNFCALCPCPNIRADIIQAKTQFIDRDGLKFGVRTIENIERIGKVCGAFPRMTNFLLRNPLTERYFKQALGIHSERRFPEIPRENFANWAQKKRLHIQRNPGKQKKVAYFVGCTGRYLFPEVPRAAVTVLEANGIDVFYPQQKCCGMPSLLEGDRNLTMAFVRFNLEQLLTAVEDGYDIVCSCPTCGFFLKKIISEGAYYSADYQKTAGQNEDQIKVPVGRDLLDGHERNGFMVLKKSIYGSILKDDGYFAELSPTQRILIAEHTFDLGEYLQQLDEKESLKRPSNPVGERMVYFPPCHGREQNIGRPYPQLLTRIPDIQLDSIDGHFYCCGMAGIMGFKKDFHEASIHLGQRLTEKIKALNPDRIVTDCLSCRIQFNQLTPYRVSHPVEVLSESYAE
jgi:glycerol-3-phosphate dehydrogenase subunit C